MRATLERLALNQFVVPRLGLAELAESCRRHEITGLGVLRATIEELGPAVVARTLRAHGVRPTSSCVALGLIAPETDTRAALVADATHALELATELGVPLVVVTGGTPPGMPAAEALDQVRAALQRLDERAVELGNRVLLEPLHPVLARHSVVTSLAEAAGMVTNLRATGLVLDTWHVWQEPDLAATIGRYAHLIDIVHLADWADGPAGTTDRALPGTGAAGLAALCRRIGDACREGPAWWEIEVLAEALTRQYGEAELLELCVRTTRRMLWPSPDEERSRSCA